MSTPTPSYDCMSASSRKARAVPRRCRAPTARTTRRSGQQSPYPHAQMEPVPNTAAPEIRLTAGQTYMSIIVKVSGREGARCRLLHARAGQRRLFEVDLDAASAQSIPVDGDCRSRPRLHCHGPIDFESGGVVLQYDRLNIDSSSVDRAAVQPRRPWRENASHRSILMEESRISAIQDCAAAIPRSRPSCG